MVKVELAVSFGNHFKQFYNQAKIIVNLSSAILTYSKLIQQEYKGLKVANFRTLYIVI